MIKSNILGNIWEKEQKRHIKEIRNLLVIFLLAFIWVGGVFIGFTWFAYPESIFLNIFGLFSLSLLSVFFLLFLHAESQEHQSYIQDIIRSMKYQLEEYETKYETKDQKEVRK